MICLAQSDDFSSLFHSYVTHPVTETFIGYKMCSMFSTGFCGKFFSAALLCHRHQTCFKSLRYLTF